MLTPTDLPDRIRLRVIEGSAPTAPLRPVQGDCWLWTGWHNSAGYPYVRFEGRDQPVHRVLFSAATGSDLSGLDLDHVCRNVACVRPDHHEAVSHAENMTRLSEAQTRCRRAGHDWTNPRNVRTRINGRRYCAECERIALRARWSEKGF